MQFLTDYGLIIMLGLLLVFMFWSSRRRQQKMKAEQEAKALRMVPGTKVLMQGGLYGTIVEYDATDLSRPAIIELAPGVEIEVHSQAILREADTTTGVVTEDEYIEAEEHNDEYVAAVESGEITSVSDDLARDVTVVDDADGDSRKA